MDVLAVKDPVHSELVRLATQRHAETLARLEQARAAAQADLLRSLQTVWDASDKDPWGPNDAVEWVTEGEVVLLKLTRRE